MKTPKQWVNENSQSGPFDTVIDSEDAEKLIQEIQLDAMKTIDMEAERRSIFCEWKDNLLKDFEGATSCGHIINYELACLTSGFTFCPYCGKVIKEVSE